MGVTDRPKIKLQPYWPNERQWVTAGMFCLIILLLSMAVVEPKLWTIEIYKSVLQAVVITGLLNMILAFHFSANKTDEVKADNTAKAFEAITATAKAGGTEPDVTLKPGETAQAENQP